jgi:hypothetical protein
MNVSYDEVQARMADQYQLAERRRMAGHARRRQGVRFVAKWRRRGRQDGLADCTGE